MGKPETGSQEVEKFNDPELESRETRNSKKPGSLCTRSRLRPDTTIRHPGPGRGTALPLPPPPPSGSTPGHSHIPPAPARPLRAVPHPPDSTVAPNPQYRSSRAQESFRNSPQPLCEKKLRLRYPDHLSQGPKKFRQEQLKSRILPEFCIRCPQDPVRDHRGFSSARTTVPARSGRVSAALVRNVRGYAASLK